MRAAIVAISALIGITACNRDAEKAKDKAADAAAKTGEEARKAGEYAKEGAEKTGDAAKDAAHAAKEGAEKAGHEAKDAAEEGGHAAKEGAEKTAVAAKALLGMDYGKTEADKQLTSRIRSAIKKDKSIPESEKDMAIRTEDGKVRLTGTLSSREAKDDIVRIATDIAGPSNVKVEIKMAERVGEGPKD
ncbi:MAG TPA: BON domain-containing protein [Fibrobacteria bacterium]|nr:BON domain-containing protein [Fibrobacteria bacterium]